MSHEKTYADTGVMIEEVLSELQQLNVVVPKPAEVRDYLLNYPGMIDLLQPFCRIAREGFEIPTQLSLEVYRDPEVDDEDLTLYVRQEHCDDQIMDIIEDIRTEYYKHLTGESGWLHLTTDFRPPK
jgi:hypothetical protein